MNSIRNDQSFYEPPISSAVNIFPDIGNTAKLPSTEPIACYLPTVDSSAPSGFFSSVSQKVRDFFLQAVRTEASEIDLRSDAVKAKAFQITGSAEGPSFGSIQTIDKGIVSYGRYQATLASGTLGEVLDEYWDTSKSETAKSLKKYETMVSEKSVGLRDDSTFLSLLRDAGNEEEMKAAQNSVFLRKFFLPAATWAEKTGLKSPLAAAIFFDTNVQGGLMDVLRATNNATQNSPLQEGPYLQEFLLQRRSRLLRLAENNEKTGNLQDAYMLRSSAGERINKLLRLVDEGNFQLEGKL